MKHALKTALFALMFPALAAVAPASLADEGGDAAMTKDIEQAVEALKHTAAAQKDAALQKAKLTLDDMNKQIKQLENQLNDDWSDLNQFARQSNSATLDKLHDQRDELSRRYDELKSSSASAWDNAKQGFIDSYNKLKETIGNAQEEF